VPTLRSPAVRSRRRPAPRRILPGALCAAALALPAAALAASPAAAAPAPSTTDPAEAAAGWLARQLVDGTHYVFDFDGVTPDQGLTADAVLSMAGAGVAGASTDAAADWLAGNSADYLVIPDFDGDGEPDGPSPGAHAKLALVAEATGRDPHAYGGDLLGRLRELECPASGRADCTPAEEGLFKAPTPSGAYPSVFTQALAIVALRRSPVEADHDVSAPVDHLLTRQCADGGFPSQFPAPGAPCVSDVDGTGLAIQALVAAGTDATEALAWLESKRRADGSFAGLVPDESGNQTEVVNANSTALAAQALIAAGEDATASIEWLAEAQVGCAGPAAQRGAVTYAGTYDGRALRATAQAALALAGGSLLDADGAGAAAAAPVLACAGPPSASPTSSPTAPGGTPPPGGPDAQPAPKPDLAATNGVDGRLVRLLTLVGVGMVAAGAAALVLVRRQSAGAPD
jgi:hypothetical protein